VPRWTASRFNSSGVRVVVDVSEVATAVRQSTLPVALVDLESFTAVASSQAAAAMLGLAPSDVQDLVPLVTAPEIAREELGLLRRGVFRSYEARRQFRRGDGAIIETVVWARAIEGEEPTRYALVVLADPLEAESTRQGTERDAVIGTVDAKGSITHISADVSKLLGYTIAASVGSALIDFVHPDDVQTVLEALASASSHSTNVGVEVRMRGSDRSWQRFALSIRPLEHDHESLGFAALPSEEKTSRTIAAGERVAELERHLIRIAREVEAAGVMARSARVRAAEGLPESPELTARQWQVLQRLLRGERVPTIARGMFLSPSTIRNYLSDLYRVFGVHSQAELIERFREDDEAPSG
jgi:PAS domain S-box-containing protein